MSDDRTINLEPVSVAEKYARQDWRWEHGHYLPNEIADRVRDDVALTDVERRIVVDSAQYFQAINESLTKNKRIDVEYNSTRTLKRRPQAVRDFLAIGQWVSVLYIIEARYGWSVWC